jgi:hypothetical protein
MVLPRFVMERSPAGLGITLFLLAGLAVDTIPVRAANPPAATIDA